MNNRALRLAGFILRYAVVGLAVAFILLYVFPGADAFREPAAPAAGQPPPGMQGVVSYSDAVAAVAPAVVNVYIGESRRKMLYPLFRDPLSRRFIGRPEPPAMRRGNLGSGVIMDQRGYLLTNAHVIRGAVDEDFEILITLYDGRQAVAEIIGIDVETDLAVLKIAAGDLPAAPVGDSSRTRTGDVVLAIGNPYDFGRTVTQGIVSATGRNRLGITTFEDFIQTDAAINPGNSGGALVSAAGELIGINTAIVSNSGGSQGIGFAIPSNLALDIMRQLIEHGHVVRGWLGVDMRAVPADIAAAAELHDGGILIVAVFSGGPAAAAGIQPGDIMTGVNGQPLYNPQQVISLISRHRPGAVIEIDVLRNWERKTVNVQVAERPAFRR